MTPPRNKLTQYITERYRENLDAIRNACDAPEPAPEHAVDDGDVERIMRALEQGRRATRRPMPGANG
jgi:hypothetical protein